MAGIFLSYARSDRALAHQVVGALRRIGVEVWWDEDTPGVDWQEELARQIDAMAAVAVLWTPDSASSKHVRDAARLGLDQDKLINLLAGLDGAPFPFDRVGGFPVDGWDGVSPHGGWTRVVQAIEQRAVAADAAPAPPPDAWPNDARIAPAPEVAAAPTWRPEAAGALPAATAPGGQGELLTWLHDRRLAAVATGAAPFAAVSRTRRTAPAAATAGAPSAPAASRGKPVPADPRAARPARSSGTRTALLGGVAAAGALVLASTVLFVHAGRPAPPPAGGGDNASPPPSNASTTAQMTDPVQGLAGSWAPRNLACDQAVRLTVTESRLLVQHPGGGVDAGDVENVGGDGVVTVKMAAGEVRYSVDGGVLTVTDAAGSTSSFLRCPADASSATNSAALGGEAVLIAMAAAGVAGVGPAQPILDEVDVSAFAPNRLRAGQTMLVQIYLHLVDHAQTVSDRARAADAQATLRGQTSLGLELERGTRVEVMLDAGGLDLDEPVQSLVWRGRPCACQFAVSAAAGAALGQRLLTARVLVAGVPLGRLAFSLTVVRADEGAAVSDLTGESAKRYTRAFLSYTSSDRPDVVRTAQTLRAAGIEYFQDILSIEPGAEWRDRLYAEIDRCDLFLLFWSWDAAESKWVREEAEYALARHRSSTEATPDIRPIILEGPPIPPPPPSLAELHFNDMLRYVVVASELEARARQSPGGEGGGGPAR